VQVTIVLPARNEADNLSEILPEIARAWAARGPAHEIVVVDDGSRDETAVLVQELGGMIPSLRLIRLGRPLGKSAALHAGISAARGEWIATMDADGQNDPAELLSMWSYATRTINDKPILVIGRRVVREDGAVNRITSGLSNRLAAFVMRHEIHDVACGMLVFRAKDYSRVHVFDNMHRFMPTLFIMMGGSVRSVPVREFPRRHGISHYGTWDRAHAGALDLAGVWWLRRRSRGVNGVFSSPDSFKAKQARNG
jgi:dolichol-phosphate mannosyltransferase